MFDLLIKDAIVLFPSGFAKASIAVEDEKIVGIGSEPAFSSADRVIDASGKYLLPGLIDTHAHFRDPGFTYKEDFTTGTMAAAAGGVTTFFDMPNVNPPTNTVKRFNEKKEIAKQKSLVDFNHLVGVTDNTTQNIASARGESLVIKYNPLFDEIPKLAAAGAPGYKIFMADGVYPHPSELFVDDDGILLDLFDAIVKSGLVLSIHPLDKNIYDNDIRKRAEKGLKDPKSFFEVRAHYGGISMTSGVVRLLPLQLVTKVRMNLLHVYTKDSLEFIRDAKRRGQDVTTEANPQHAFLKPSDIDRLGPYALTATTNSNIKALWEALNDGTIDLIATDHAPHTKEEIEPGWQDVNKIPYGAPEIQEYLRLFLTEANRGNISLEKVSQLCSENPAGEHLYPLWPFSHRIRSMRSLVQASLFAAQRGIVRPRILGRERLEGLVLPAIFALEYRSTLDLPFVLAAMPRSIRERLGISTTWKAEDGNRCIDAIMAFFFNSFRYSPSGSRHATLVHASGLLDHGWSILFLLRGDPAQPGQDGGISTSVGLLAAEFGAPVVPIHIAGLGGRLPSWRILRRGTVTVQFGQPIVCRPGSSYVDVETSLEAGLRALAAEG